MGEDVGRGFRLAVVAIVVAVPAGCAGVAELTYDWLARRQVRAVDEGAVPASFPVVVLTGPEEAPAAQVVPFAALEDVLATHAGARFLVPEAGEAALRDAVRPWTGAAQPGDTLPPLLASFDVVERQPGRQLVRAQLVPVPGQVNAGWYEATPHGVRPLRHQSYEVPGLRFAALFAGFVLTAGPGAALLIWLDRRRRRGRDGSAPGAAGLA